MSTRSTSRFVAPEETNLPVKVRHSPPPKDLGVSRTPLGADTDLGTTPPEIEIDILQGGSLPRKKVTVLQTRRLQRGGSRCRRGRSR